MPVALKFNSHGFGSQQDSSAVQVLPRVRVSKHTSDQTKHAFLLKVANPTLGTIRMKLASSNYLGEPVWDEPSSTTYLLQNVLVDPFTEQVVTALLMPDVVDRLTSTEVCELEPAEDSFLELGKSSDEVPEAVSNWDACSVLIDSKVCEDGPTSSLKLISSKNSMAWFELIVMEGTTRNGVVHGVPLAMQIEIGDGSWESSLVHPELKSESKVSQKDVVTFDLVIVW